MRESQTPTNDPLLPVHVPAASKRVSGLLLSLILVPGAGHLLLGINRRGLAWFLAMAFVLVFSPLSIWFMIAGFFGARFASALDLWLCARAPRSVPALSKTVLPVGGLVLIFFVFTAALRIYGAEAFKIPSSAMEPTLRIGDHLMVSKFDSSPQPGEVVVFTYPCNPRKDFIKRIVALEGDSVEVRCDRLYINGKLVEREAMSTECSYQDFDGGRWFENACSSYRESLGGQSYQVIHRPGPERGHDEPGGHDFPGHQAPSCEDTYEGSAAANTEEMGRISEHGSSSESFCSAHRAYVVPKGHFFVMGDNRDNSSDSRVWGAVPNDAIRGQARYIWWSRQGDRGVSWDRVGLGL